MKELFIQQMNERIADMSDAEYQDWLNSQEITGIPNGNTMSDTDDDCCGGDCHCEGESATQEDKESEHDAWWNSLTDEQKQQLYEEQESYEKERMEREIDEEAYGVDKPSSILDIEATIEDRMDIEDEMNHDLGFGK